MSFALQAKKQQRIAIARPCQEADQCENLDYFWWAGIGPNMVASVGLTVNVGQE